MLFIVLCFASKGSSQQYHFSFSPVLENYAEPHINSSENSFHSQIKPFRLNEIKKCFNIDSLISDKYFNNYSLLNTDCYKKQIRDFEIKINPEINISSINSFSGNQPAGEAVLGLDIKGNYNSFFAFNAKVIYGNSMLSGLPALYADSSGIIPGQGFAHKAGSRYEYWNNSFYASVSPSKYFNIEAGFGRNFWGDGHRSLFLSDIAYSYPYLKAEANIWKIKYINLWTNFKDLRQGKADANGNFQDKYATMHLLSVNVTKRINISFFESIVWKHSDSAGIRGFDYNYLNPVIFFRPVEFSLGSPDNALMGFSTKFNISNRCILYTQILLDDMIFSELRKDFKHIVKPDDTTVQWGSWMNKQALQLGAKVFHVFGVKNLNILTELNLARPYTYSHRQSPQNYAHYNQPLAHPLGGNFYESVGIVKYSKSRFFAEVYAAFAVTGLDTGKTHFGQDVFKPTYDTPEHTGNIPVKQYGNYISQGLKTSILNVRLKASYLINPAMNLRIEIGYMFRNEYSDIHDVTNSYIFAGIKTSLSDFFTDY